MTRAQAEVPTSCGKLASLSRSGSSGSRCRHPALKCMSSWKALLPVLLLAVLQICWLHSSSLHHPLALVPVIADGSQAEALPLRSFGLLSLRQALAAGVLTELRVHLGYGGRLGMWNAFPHIKAALTRAGYASTTAGYNNAAVMIVPNYWRPDAADWRRWRLAPYQRINRLWGMHCISRKETRSSQIAPPTISLSLQYSGGKCPRGELPGG